jgi:hypothetical protein
LPKEEAKKETQLSVSSVEVVLRCKDKATAESLKVYDSKKYVEAKKEIAFTKHVSPKDKSFRLVHDGEKVLMFFEAEGETHTAQKMFCGIKEECEKEIDSLGLRLK